MNDQRHDDGCPHDELAVGWALHSLEPAEESLIAAHLPVCPICAWVTSQVREVGAMLGLSVPEVIPSAELEQRILSVTGDQWTAPVVPLTPPAPPARPLPKPSRPRFRELTAAAAAVLVAA
ncbi:MAG: hypothetical protein ACRDTX_25620, partial [Pseudonocardiaceae bacterium]